MPIDKSYFEQTAANFSEITLLSAVAELAVKKDLESLAVFIDFVKTASTPLPIVNANAKFRIPYSDPTGIIAVHGVESHPNDAGIVEHLMKSLKHGLQTSDFTALPFTPLEPKQLAYLDLVVDLAQSMKEQGVWRHAIFEAIARDTNDPAVLSHLPLDRYDVAAKTMASNSANSGANKPGEATLASEALCNGNFALGVAMFKRMPENKITGLDPEHTVNKPLCEHHVRLVAKAMTREPRTALDLLEVWGEKAPKRIDNMRASIFKAAMRNIPDGKQVEPAMLMEIIGSKPEHFDRFQSALNGRSDGLQIVRDIVGKHLVEALPLVSSFALIEEHNPHHNKRLGIQDAIGSGSLRVDDRAGEVRLKTTLQFLINHGHDINRVIDDEDAGALKVLANSGRKDDITRKLHVLLDLGADPKQKDQRNWLPSSHVGTRVPEQKQAWLNVERSFSARNKSLGLLDEIEQDMATPAVGKKRRP